MCSRQRDHTEGSRRGIIQRNHILRVCLIFPEPCAHALLYCACNPMRTRPPYVMSRKIAQLAKFSGSLPIIRIRKYGVIVSPPSTCIARECRILLVTSSHSKSAKNWNISPAGQFHVTLLRYWSARLGMLPLNSSGEGRSAGRCNEKTVKREARVQSSDNLAWLKGLTSNQCGYCMWLQFQSAAVHIHAPIR